MFTIGEIYMN